MSTNELAKRLSDLVTNAVGGEHSARAKAAGPGAALGATVGSMVGGPVGAAVGAALGGGIAVIATEKFGR
jgi:hypothetical protein